MALTGIVATTTLAELLGMEVGDILSGGGGIESESGSFETEERGTIYSKVVEYENEHERPADLIAVCYDGSYTGAIGNGRMLWWSYWYAGNVLNIPMYKVGNATYGGISYITYSTSTSNVTLNTQFKGKQLLFSDTQELDGSYDSTKPKTYSTKTGFTCKSETGTTQLLNGCKYNWKAFWLPVAEEQG